MPRKRKNPMMFHEPTTTEAADYAMDHAVEKAVLNHPETKKLAAKIMAEMQKAAKTPTPKAPTRKSAKR